MRDGTVEPEMTPRIANGSDNNVVSMSILNSLLQKNAKVKPLKQPKPRLGFRATPNPFKVIAPVAFNSHSSLPFLVPERHG